MRLAGFSLVLATAVIGAAHAQAPRLPTPPVSWTPAFAATSFEQRATAARDSTPRKIRRTYWLEGGLIGGVVVGLLGSQFCRIADSPRGSCEIEVFLISGTFIGFPAGALIGGQFKKD